MLLDFIFILGIITFFVGVLAMSGKESAGTYVFLWLFGLMLTFFLTFLLKWLWICGLSLEVVYLSGKNVELSHPVPQVIHEGWNLFCSISTALMIAGIYSLFLLFSPPK